MIESLPSTLPSGSAAASLAQRWRALWGCPRVRHHALLFGAFVATRVALYAAGLRFKLDLAWMFLSDLPDLRDRLLETVYYFHAFAPGMNLITGWLLKLAPSHLTLAASLLFWASGWLLLVSACRVFALLGCSPWTARGLALALSLLPQSLYFENLYLYTHLCTSLLCLAAACFHRALERASKAAWFSFFLVCAVLGWLYTTFHLLWFVLVALGCVILARRGRRRAVFLGAAAPATLLLVLYLKNYAVFGVFGATSWAGANVTLSTTRRMSAELRKEWIAEGKLSPFAGISVFAPPKDYLPLLASDLHFPWPGSNSLWRRSVNAPNFNHGLYLDVNRVRQKDAAYFIQHRPFEYLRLVFGSNLPALFSSTTHWHPQDTRETSPHHQHRQVLGAYERLYDGLVHRWPVRPVGLYVLLPPFWLGAAVRSWRGLRSAEPARRHTAALLAFCLLQIAFIVSASCLFSSFESARYRYTVEPFIWAIVASGLGALSARIWPKLRPRAPRRGSAPPGRPGAADSAPAPAPRGRPGAWLSL